MGAIINPVIIITSLVILNLPFSKSAAKYEFVKIPFEDHGNFGKIGVLGNLF